MSLSIQEEVLGLVGSFTSDSDVSIHRKFTVNSFRDEFHKSIHVSVENGSAVEEFIEKFNDQFGLTYKGFYPKTKQILGGCWAVEIWYDPKKVH